MIPSAIQPFRPFHRSAARAAAVALSISVVFTSVPATAFAVTPDWAVETGLCKHHPAHNTDECGYREAEPGHPCEHEHAAKCYTGKLICGYMEGEEVQTASGSNAPHHHAKDCFWLDCPHERGEHDNCGYIEAGAGAPCGYVCAECGAPDKDSEKKPGTTGDMVLTAFDDLDEAVRYQSVPAGTKQENLLLPDALGALGYKASHTETDPVAVTVKGVSWEPDSPWDEDAQQGSYIFTLVLPEGYTLAAGAKPPELYVRVGESPVLFGSGPADSYHDGDVAAINDIITDNGLVANKNKPEEWASSKIVTWNSKNPKRIRRLNVNGKELRGTLNVSGLTDLTRLDCFDNQLTALEGLGSLTELTFLNCGNNQLTALEGLGNLTKLTNLGCSGNQLTALEGLGSLTELTDLNCSKNQLTALEGLGSLTKLINLSCGMNQLTALEGLGSLTNLRTLLCYANQLTALEGLENLANLSNLQCQNNPIASLKLPEGKQLKVNSAEGGTVVLFNYLHNSNSVTLKATAEDGYVFKRWTAEGTVLANTTVNPVTFDLNGAITITPVFEKPVLTPTAEQGVIYANGLPLLLVAGSPTVTNTVVYIDKDGSGTVTEGDIAFDPDGKSTAMNDTKGGNDLSSWTIFGGSCDEPISSNTKITMTGGRVKGIFGGNLGSSVTGSVSIDIRGGTVDYEVRGGSTTGAAVVTVGGGAKIGTVGNFTGIVINGGAGEGAVTNSVDSFAIDSALTGDDGCVRVLLPDGFDVTGNPTIATGAVQGDLARIKLAGGGATNKEAYFANGEIKIREKDHVHCVCGGTVTTGGHTHDAGVTWIPWESGDALPDAAGSYYLTKDVVLDRYWTVPAGTVNLCFNGKKVRNKEDSFSSYGTYVEIPENNELTVCDCGIGGGMAFTMDTTNGYLSGLSGGRNSSFAFYNGNIKLTKNGSGQGNGLINQGGTFDIYDGTVTADVYAGRFCSMLAFEGSTTLWSSSFRAEAMAQEALVISAEVRENATFRLSSWPVLNTVNTGNSHNAADIYTYGGKLYAHAGNSPYRGSALSVRIESAAYLDGGVVVREVNSGNKNKFTVTNAPAGYAQAEVNESGKTHLALVGPYQVAFDANGGQGSMENQNFTGYADSQALTGNAFVKEGCFFTGWNAKADGSGAAYADKAEVSKLAYGGAVTLYAQWEESPKSADATLSTLTYTVEGGSATDVPGFAADAVTYHVTLPYGTAHNAIITLAGMPNNANATVTENNGVTLAGGSGIATIKVTAEDENTTKTYTVNFTTAADTRSDSKQITAFTIQNQVGDTVINQNRRTITVNMPSGADVTRLTPAITLSQKAGVSPQSGSAQNFSHPVVYTVTAENGTTQDYTVTVVVQTPSVTSVTVSPAGISVHRGGAQQFTAAVSGTNNPAQTVTWSIESGHASGTSISESGLLTVASSESQDFLTIKAVSAIDTSKSGTVTVGITDPSPAYGIFLSQAGTYTFSAATAGYGEQAACGVTVNNSGSQPTGVLTVGLSGANASCFTLSGTNMDSIAPGGSGVFTVKPKTGLAPGAYAAMVTVTGGNGISGSFSVSFTVSPAQPLTYAISGTIKGSDTQKGIAATLQLKDSQDTDIGNPVIADMDGAYTITGVPAGAYSIQVSCPGYDSGTIRDVVVPDDNVTGKDLTLQKTVTAAPAAIHTITDSQTPSLSINTQATGDGGSVTTITATSTDTNGKKTTVTIKVRKDAAGNVTESVSAVTTDNITTQSNQGSAGVTVYPDAAAINSAAEAAGASAQSPADLSVAMPQDAVNNQIQKQEVAAVQVNVVLPKPVRDNPAVQTVGVNVEKETVEAARQSGKKLEVAVREEDGSVEAVWSLDGQAMKNAAEQATDLNLGVRMAPVQSADPIAAPVKPTVTGEGHENGLVLSVTADGTLLSSAKLTVPATNQTGIEAGSSVAVYRFDPDTGGLNPVSGGLYDVDANGNVTIDVPAGTRTGAKETYVLLPIPAARKTAAGAEGDAVHTVKAGDTLNRISRQYGCRVEDLLALNPGVDIYNLRIGSNLRIR